MAKQEDTLRWQFLLDEDRWESRSATAALLDPETAAENAPGRVRATRLWALTVAAVFLAGAASFFWLAHLEGRRHPGPISPGHCALALRGKYGRTG